MFVPIFRLQMNDVVQIIYCGITHYFTTSNNLLLSKSTAVWKRFVRPSVCSELQTSNESCGTIRICTYTVELRNISPLATICYSVRVQKHSNKMLPSVTFHWSKISYVNNLWQRPQIVAHDGDWFDLQLM